MENQEKFEKIEAYLNGELKGDALSQFEEQLKKDQTLAAEVNLVKNIDHALLDEGALALQEQTNALGDEFFGQNEASIKRLPFYRRPLAVAASIVLLVTFGLLWWLTNNTPGQSGAELFAVYYEPHSFANAVRGAGDESNFYIQAAEAFEQGDLAEAERLFKAHIAVLPNDIRASYGLACTFLQNSPPALEEAVRYFQVVVRDGRSIFADKAKWYIALIQLKKQDLEAAEALLNDLQSSEDLQIANQAKTLLKELGK